MLLANLVLHCVGVFPDVEELKIDNLEEEANHVSYPYSKQKVKWNPLNLQESNQNDNRTLNEYYDVHKYSVSWSFHLSVWFVLIWKREDLVVHVEVADTIEDALVEYLRFLPAYPVIGWDVLCGLPVDKSHEQCVQQDKEGQRPQLSITTGVGKEDKSEQARKNKAGTVSK